MTLLCSHPNLLLAGGRGDPDPVSGAGREGEAPGGDQAEAGHQFPPGAQAEHRQRVAGRDGDACVGPLDHTLVLKGACAPFVWGGTGKAVRTSLQFSLY